MTEAAAALAPGEVLVHVGLPKSGTTALQSALARGRSDLADLGVVYPGRTPHHNVAARSAAPWARSGDGPPPREWARLVRQVQAASESRVVVSSELLVGFGVESAQRVIASLGGSRVRIAVMVRPLEFVLPSDWQQTVKNGSTVPYDEWLRDVCRGPGHTLGPAGWFWLRQDASAVVERWVQATGDASRVTVVTLDPADRSALFRSFETLLGVPGGTIRPDAGDRTNRSLSAEEAELLRALNVAAAASPDADGFHRLVQGRILVERRTPGSVETVLSTPAWAVGRARELGREMVERLSALDVAVLGDLDALVPSGEQDSSTTVTAQTAATAVPLDVAMLLITDVLARVRGSGEASPA
jgi:hypothetical protein